MENLLYAWEKFLSGKKDKNDVAAFQVKLMDNTFCLFQDLKNKTYIHGRYAAFNIADPKPRNIHKASVRDRLLHHLIYQEFYGYFDKKFIYDSYSCRINKGTHKAVRRFVELSRKVSWNNARTCFILKGDIKKFFANINHLTLENILKIYIIDQNILNLLSNIIRSFSLAKPGVGSPLGNLTSQIFVNIYMNEFDQFIKHKLKAKCYIRYCDDFVIFSENRDWLQNIIPTIQEFLQSHLGLELHQNKMFIKTIFSGMDFLGWKHFPTHRLLRSATKRRMMKRIQKNPKPETLASYFGLLKHGDTEKIKRLVWEEFLLRQDD